MDRRFFEQPILNSPYEYPSQHWELDESGQPTNRVVPERRKVSFITPIPKPKKQKETQPKIVFDAPAKALESGAQQYDLTTFISGMRHRVDRWRELPDPASWRVTPETARLLQHWRGHRFGDIRPFFCQVEAVETAIWLTEVAPSLGKEGKQFIDQMDAASEEANPGLARLALKLATGAGKTTVMAMIIAWQTVNAVRRPGSKRFTRGFLVVTPGVTIRDRLRVLQPNDPDSYYASRELMPGDMLRDLERAKIVITNYHAFMLRERLELSKGGRALLQGSGPELGTKETVGQMLQRVMPGLMGLKRILALNDEAHHCYREKPASEDEEGPLKGDDRKEAEKNQEAARVWISGLEAVQRKLGLQRVIDLSATPFFLRGSGYAEGTLFPWTASDFSLMDAIECGIVKLPRVPVADNIPGGDMPKFRNLWEHIRSKMPKRGRARAGALDPLSLPVEFQTALEALYGHYEKTFELWAKAGIEVPPCFIVVCNNTSTSKLVHDFISGFHRENADGSASLVNGRLALFRNFDEHGNPLARPRTLLIDSEQLDSGEALNKSFRDAAADEIDRFRREIVARTGDRRQAEHLSDQDLLREVMNTVGKPGALGGSAASRVEVTGDSLAYVRYLDDFGAIEINNLWDDVGGIQSRSDPKVYVVQSPTPLIQRCILATTTPGDLVLDPTCGSGTTAYVAEQWGRRWITIDTSRVALALARARIVGARYPYYLLADSPDGQRKEAEITGTVSLERPTRGMSGRASSTSAFRTSPSSPSPTTPRSTSSGSAGRGRWSRCGMT